MRDRRETPRAHARALSWAIGGGIILVVALVLASRSVTQPAPPPPKSPPPRPVVDTQANCETVRMTYLTALAPLQACTSDDECMVEPRDGVRSGLEGCARFRRVDASAKLAELVDPIEQAWIARGCANAFLTCAPRRARCNAGMCVERPPEPVPLMWRRFDYAAYGVVAFSFFVPPGLIQKPYGGECDEGGQLEGPRYTVKFAYGNYPMTLEARPEEGSTAIDDHALTISGRRANVQVTRTREGRFWSGVHVPEVVTEPRAGHKKLTVWAECATQEDCADLAIIARSLEIH